MATMEQLDRAISKANEFAKLVRDSRTECDELAKVCNEALVALDGDPLPWSTFEEFDKFMMSGKTLVL